MACMMTASLRATATQAFFFELRLASRRPQAFRSRSACRPAQQHLGRLEEMRAHEGIAALRDMAVVIDLAGGVFARRQPHGGADSLRMSEPFRSVNKRLEGQGGQRSDAGDRHEELAYLIFLHVVQNQLFQHLALLDQVTPHFQHRKDVGLQFFVILDQFPDALLVRCRRHLADLQPEDVSAIRGSGCQYPSRLSRRQRRLLSSTRSFWLSWLLTCTSLYQPVRMMWARPRASLRSVFTC